MATTRYYFDYDSLHAKFSMRSTNLKPKTLLLTLLTSSVINFPIVRHVYSLLSEVIITYFRQSTSSDGMVVCV